MKKQIQGPKMERRWQVDSGVCCTAEIVELPTPAIAEEEAVLPGIVAILAAATGSDHLARIRAALWSHTQKSADLIRNLAGRVRPRRKSGAGSLQLALKYRGHTVLSCAYSARVGFSAAFVEHPGCALSEREFSVAIDAVGQSLPLEVLVVLQSPALSALERQMCEHVPVDLSFLNRGLGLGCGAQLMITDQGWALGGLLSKVAVMTLRRDGEDVGQSGEQKRSGTKREPFAVSPTETVNLAGLAESLLRHYLEAQA